MFIAVTPYKGEYVKNTKKVLVMDTKDLSIEYVSILELSKAVKSNNGVMHIGKEVFLNFNCASGLYISGEPSLHSCLDHMVERKPELLNESYISFVKYGNTVSYTFKEYSFEIYRDTTIHINGTSFTIEDVLQRPLFVHYVFRYKDYIVICLVESYPKFEAATFLGFIPEVLSVILDRRSNVVCIYDDNGLLYGSSKLMSRVEITCVR